MDRRPFPVIAIDRPSWGEPPSGGRRIYVEADWESCKLAREFIEADGWLSIEYADGHAISMAAYMNDMCVAEVPADMGWSALLDMAISRSGVLIVL